MNLPRGYSNLSILSTFFHESRAITIQRAKAGEFKTAKRYGRAKLDTWIIATSEMLDILNQHRQAMPEYAIRLELMLRRDAVPHDKDEAMALAKKQFADICELFSEIVDCDQSDFFVEEYE